MKRVWQCNRCVSESPSRLPDTHSFAFQNEIALDVNLLCLAGTQHPANVVPEPSTSTLHPSAAMAMFNEAPEKTRRLVIARRIESKTNLTVTLISIFLSWFCRRQNRIELGKDKVACGRCFMASITEFCRKGFSRFRIRQCVTEAEIGPTTWLI